MDEAQRVRDPEMDMIRTDQFKARIKISQMLAFMLRWLAPTLHHLETPRRSVDRESGPFSNTAE